MYAYAIYVSFYYESYTFKILILYRKCCSNLNEMLRSNNQKKVGQYKTSNRRFIYLNSNFYINLASSELFSLNIMHDTNNILILDVYSSFDYTDDHLGTDVYEKCIYY